MKELDIELGFPTPIRPKTPPEDNDFETPENTSPSVGQQDNSSPSMSGSSTSQNSPITSRKELTRKMTNNTTTYKINGVTFTVEKMSSPADQKHYTLKKSIKHTTTRSATSYLTKFKRVSSKRNFIQSPFW